MGMEYNQKCSSWSLVAGIVLSVLFYVGVFWGCAPQQTAQKGMSAARKKAIEDSLRKVQQFEILKSWSSGYEYYKNKMYRNSIKPLLKVVKLDTLKRYKNTFL